MMAAAYRLNPISSGVIRIEDQAFIPDDEGNRDWREYQEWLTAGNKPDPAEPLPQAFPVISDRQFYQALALAGEITKDEALAAVSTGEIPEIIRKHIDAIPDPNEQFAARMLLSGATQFERHHPLVDQFGKALGWSDEQLDELWKTAAAL